MAKTTGKKGGKKIGRKKRKMAFQRYKVSDRFMDRIKRHAKRHPADKWAASTLDKMRDARTWVGWRIFQKQRRDTA